MRPFHTVAQLFLILSIANSALAVRTSIGGIGAFSFGRPSTSSSSSSSTPWTNKDLFEFVRTYTIQGAIAGLMSGLGGGINRVIIATGEGPYNSGGSGPQSPGPTTPTPTPNPTTPIPTPTPTPNPNPAGNPNPYTPGPANATNSTGPGPINTRGNFDSESLHASAVRDILNAVTRSLRTDIAKSSTPLKRAWSMSRDIDVSRLSDKELVLLSVLSRRAIESLD